MLQNGDAIINIGMAAAAASGMETTDAAAAAAAAKNAPKLLSKKNDLASLSDR